MNKDNTVDDIITQAIQILIEKVSQEKNVLKSIRLHDEKIHFVPPQYRVLGGVLQSLNIRFGNFIEILLRSIIESEETLQLCTESGKKLSLSIAPRTDSMIDTYISKRQLPNK